MCARNHCHSTSLLLRCGVWAACAWPFSLVLVLVLVLAAAAAVFHPWPPVLCAGRRWPLGRGRGILADAQGQSETLVRSPWPLKTFSQCQYAALGGERAQTGRTTAS